MFEISFYNYDRCIRNVLTYRVSPMEYPIYNAELRYQNSAIEKSSVSRFWIVMASALILPAALATIGYFIAAMLEYRGARITNMGNINDVGTALINIGQITLVTLNIAQYIVLMMVGYGLTSNAITRERRASTWDLLLLTYRRARHIVRGKWLASLKALNGDYGMLTLVRIGLVCMVLTMQTVFYPSGALFNRWDVLALCGLVVVMSLLDVMFNTAAALFSVLLHHSGVQSGLTFLVLRLGALIFVVWWLVNAIHLLVTRDANNDWGYIWFSFVCALSYSIAIWGMLKLCELTAIRHAQASS